MTGSNVRKIRIIDSHTGGEPTRLVIGGSPDLGSGPLSARLERFRAQHDDFRSAVVNEPRGSDVMVGALLCEPVDPACAAGVIFFNNVGYLGMCGHGTIGLVATLSYMDRIKPGEHRIEVAHYWSNGHGGLELRWRPPGAQWSTLGPADVVEPPLAADP